MTTVRLENQKELCPVDSAEWERQDPWKLLACMLQTLAVQDPFDMTPQDFMYR